MADVVDINTEDTYFTAAMRTLSTTFCLDTPGAPTKEDLIAALLDVTKAASLVDSYKKRIYYGKPVVGVNDVSLPVDGFCPEVAPVLLHHIMGMITESVELLEVVMLMSSRDRGNGTLSADLLRRFVEELGDMEWYRAGVYSYLRGQGLDVTPQMVQSINVQKLQARYTEGQFSPDAATLRDLDKETVVLARGVDA